jgi:hypothetical protein
MTRKIIASFGWQIVFGAAGIAILAFFLLIPTPRQFGLAFRYDFLPILGSIGLILILIFLIPGRLSRFLLFLLVSTIFVVPVAGLWASGQSEQYLLGGIVPFSDARGYFMDARRLLEGSQFITGAARRPLFTALLSSLQWITGQNLYLTIAILVFIIVISVYLAVREVKTIDGPLAGIFFLLLVFFYSRLLMGKTLSELAGLPLALLSLVLLLRGAQTNRLIYLVAGLFLISLGLNSRAGAFIILPFLALWIGWFERKDRSFNWRSFLLACAVVGFGFAVNLAVYKLYTSPEIVPFGNFSHTIYGLARGGLGWTQIYTEHPEIWTMPADRQANYVYSLTLEIIQRKPWNLVTGITSSVGTFFSLDDYYGSIGWFGGEGTIGNLSRIVLYILFPFGIFDCIRNFKKPSRSLVLFAFIGIFLSIPFAPPIDSNRMRVYAATIPYFVIIPCFGLSFLLNFLPWKFFKNPDPQQEYDILPAFSLAAVLILLMTLLPLIPFYFSNQIVAPSIECPTDLTQVSFRVLPGNNIRIIEQDSSSKDWVPEIREKSFSTRVHNLPNWETFPLFTTVKPGKIILADLDLKTMDAMILIADWKHLVKTSEIQSVCARPSDDPMLKSYNVFFAEEYLPVQ